MIDRPDRFRVAARGGLAVDKAFMIHEGEFTLYHDHPGSRETGGERIEAGLTERFGRGVYAVHDQVFLCREKREQGPLVSCWDLLGNAVLILQGPPVMVCRFRVAARSWLARINRAASTVRGLDGSGNSPAIDRQRTEYPEFH